MFEKKSGLEFQYIFIKQYNFNDYKCICFTLFNSIYGKNYVNTMITINVYKQFI